MALSIRFAMFMFIYLIGNVQPQAPPYDYGDGWLHKLKVTQDVTLERSSRNYNYLGELLIAKHPLYPLKRSLIQFENLAASCPLHKIRWAQMYLYFRFAHKPSWLKNPKVGPWFTHTINIHRVKRAWSESQATSGRRNRYSYWHARYLELNRDAEAHPLCPETKLYTARPVGFMEFDVTGAIRAWKEGAPNYGLLLKVVNEVKDGRDLRFKSNNFRDRSKHGYINVMCDY